MTSQFPPAGASVAPAHAVVVPDALVPERRGTVAFLSNVERGGDWILPRLFRVVSCFGNVELDLTRARLGAGTSQIEIRCVLGNVEIVVPPGVRVECDGEPIVGSFELRHEAPTRASPDAPLVRISGSAILGSIEVKVVDPNAPGWLDRMRARLARRRQG